MRAVRDSDITLYSRYECKYLVSPMVISEFRAFIRPFMRPDAFAALRPGFRYPICSLYLDSEDLVLYQQTVGGEKQRFKLRVRSYTDDVTQPVFLEVKSKLNNIVKKRRARLDRRTAHAVLDAGVNGNLGNLPADLMDDVDHFRHHVMLTQAKPVIRVRYMREAYESRGGDPVRITIDTELMHAVTLDDSWSHGTGRWVTTPVGDTIIEIKFTERFPSWINDLVRIFGLKQQPVPKYVMSVEHSLIGGRESVVSLAGFTLPPQRA
jgi:hypothetical protein